MTIRSQEEKLFSKWRAGRIGFVSDGVVSEERYAESYTKLLFVMKEVNDEGGGGWDLRELIRCGERAKTWNNLTRWTIGIRNLDRDISWTELWEISQEQRCHELQSIAAINLKKSPGGYTADSLEVKKIAKEDAAYLNQQFGFYDADFTICCGTGPLLHSLLEPLKALEWKYTFRGIPYLEPTPRKYVIAYSHPEARCYPPLLYYGLIDAVREISQK